MQENEKRKKKNAKNIKQREKKNREKRLSSNNIMLQMKKCKYNFFGKFKTYYVRIFERVAGLLVVVTKRWVDVNNISHVNDIYWACKKEIESTQTVRCILYLVCMHFDVIK